MYIFNYPGEKKEIMIDTKSINTISFITINCQKKFICNANPSSTGRESPDYDADFKENRLKYLIPVDISCNED